MLPQRLRDAWGIVGRDGRLRWGLMVLAGAVPVMAVSALGALVSPLLGNPWYQGALTCGAVALGIMLAMNVAVLVADRRLHHRER